MASIIKELKNGSNYNVMTNHVQVAQLEIMDRWIFFQDR